MDHHHSETIINRSYPRPSFLVSLTINKSCRLPLLTSLPTGRHNSNPSTVTHHYLRPIFLCHHIIMSSAANECHRYTLSCNQTPTRCHVPAHISNQVHNYRLIIYHKKNITMTTQFYSQMVFGFDCGILDIKE